MSRSRKIFLTIVSTYLTIVQQIPYNINRRTLFTSYSNGMNGGLSNAPPCLIIEISISDVGFAVPFARLP